MKISLKCFIKYFLSLPAIGGLFLPNAYAEKIIETEYGQVFVMTLKQYKDKKHRKSCGPLPTVIRYKVFQSQDNHNLTPSEYRTFAGDSPLLGLKGYDYWYSKEQQKYVGWHSVFPSNGLGGTDYDHLPILCGIKKKKTVVANKDPVYNWKKGIKSCEGTFCELSGGAYLRAIYDNNLDLIKRFDASINATLKKRFGAMMSLSRDLGKEPEDFSLLPAISNTYLFEYKSSYAQLCNQSVVTKVITHKTETYEMWNMNGMYEGQGGGEIYRATYVIKSDLVPLCNKVCDHLGGRGERWGIKKFGHSGAPKTISGVQELLKKYSCSSTDIQKFERNLKNLTNQYLSNRYDWLP